MANSFDINSRSTWAWIDGGVPSPSWARNGSDFVINPHDRNTFYQIAGGRLVMNQCAMADRETRMVFDPRLNVSDWPRNVSEADVYDWAVRVGLVTNER